MSSIIITNENGGESRFFNLSVKKYLQDQVNNVTNDAKQLRKCFYSDEINLYLSGTDANENYELIAINQEGKKQCFILECDSNLNVQNVTKTKLENLSAGSQDFFAHIQSEQSTPIRPSSQ